MQPRRSLPMPSTTPAPQDQDWLVEADWLERHAAFLRGRPARVDLLFVGDSITEGWLADGRATWDRAYAPRHPFNLGISGDETQHVLWRLDHGEIDGLYPKAVVLLIGTNNLGNGGHTPGQTAAGVAAVVDRLRAKLPASPVLLLGVLPRGADADDPLRRATLAVNHLIAPLGQRPGVTYLDLGDRFLRPDGVLPTAVMPDALHLSPAAYQTWAGAMEPTLATLLNGS